MTYLKHVTYALVIPLLYLATYWEVRKRVFTNVFLTMSRLRYEVHLENIKSIVMANVSRIIADRLCFLSLLLPFWLFRRLIMRLVPPVGIEKLDATLAHGKGAILFSCHIGPYYLTPAVLALLGYKVVAVERLGFLEAPIVNYHVGRINGLKGETVLMTTTIYDDLLLRKLRGHLRKGRIVFIMGDYRGAFNCRGKYAKFLGYDIVPGRGIAWLHSRTGAPIVPIVIRYCNGRRPQLEVRDELAVDKDQGMGYITQEVYHTLEELILQNPERWALWMDYHLMLAPEVRE